MALVAGLALAALAAPAAAQPTFSKAFAPATMGPGGTSTLRFTITNSSASPVTDLAFTDNLPAGVVIAAAPGAVSSCGAEGVLSAPAGGGTITFSNGRVGAGTACTIDVNVTSSTPGTHMNVSGTLTSSAGSSGTAAADLTVATDRPGFSKSFGPSTISLGGRSTLTFLIDNSENGSSALFLDFTDNLPDGLVIASPTNAATTCTSGALTVTAGASTVAYTGGFVGANSTCFVTADVTASAGGTLENVSGELAAVVSSVARSGGKASARLTVTVSTLAIEKSFIADPVPPGGTVTLRFRIRNFSRGNTATGVTFTDNLAATLAGLAAVAPLPASPCGAGSTLSGTTTLTLMGGTVPPEGSCTFDVTLQVPAGAAPGTYTNTTGAVTGNVGGATTGNQATDRLFVEPIPLLTKEFTDDPVGAGGSVTLRFKVTNTSTTGGATNITFLDDVSTFLGVPVSATLPANPCGAGSSIAVVATGFGGQALELANGQLGAGAMCTFDVVLAIPAGHPGGTFTNTTGSITATVAGATRTGAPASDDLVVVRAPRLRKEFLGDPVQPGSALTLQFTLEHDPNAPADATGIAFTDDLAAVLAGLASTSGTLSGICGTGSQITGTTNLTFTGGRLAPGASCTFGVTVAVPTGAPIGSHTNTTSNVTATVLGVSTQGLPASDVLTVVGLVLTKEFTDDPALPGGTVTLGFKIVNESTLGAADIFFQDDLGDTLAGLLVDPASVPATPCGGGSSITLLSGNRVIFLSGGSLAAGAMCTFSVTLDVPAAAASGLYANTTTGFAARFGGSTMFTPMPNASDRLEIIAEPLLLTKEFTNDPVAPGATVNLRFTLTNIATQAASGIGFSDNLGATGGALAGLAATGLPQAACGGTLSGTTTVTLSGAALAAGAGCTFNVTLAVPAGAAAGNYPNTTGPVSGTIGGLAVAGDPATDTLRVRSARLQKAFAKPAAASGTVALSFTLTNLSSTASLANLQFADDLNATLPGLVATGLPRSGVCGAGSQLAGGGFLAFSGGSLGPGGSCTFQVTLRVPASAVPGSHPNVTSTLRSGGLEVAPPASDTLDIVPPPAFAKAFAPAQIAAGGVSRLTLTIDNGASPLAAAALAVSDPLPAGLALASPANAATTCAGGTLTAPARGTTLALSGGSVAAGATCTIAADVTSDIPGVYVNTTGALTSSSGSSGTATANLTVTGTCAAADGVNETLQDDTLLAVRQVAVCNTVTVGPNYAVVGPNGNLMLRAGIAAVFIDGAEIGVDGQLLVVIDPALGN